jgi:hypothetical protein
MCVYWSLNHMSVVPLIKYVQSDQRESNGLKKIYYSVDFQLEMDLFL